MNSELRDDTMEEILMQDEKEIKNNGKKKRGCLFRTLVFLIIGLVGILGFIFAQQYFLDLEAEAIVRAARTSTALAGSSEEAKTIEKDHTATSEVPQCTPTPAPTSTEDPAFKRTATVAVQLTDVAAFQLTAPAEP